MPYEIISKLQFLSYLKAFLCTKLMETFLHGMAGCCCILNFFFKPSSCSVFLNLYPKWLLGMAMGARSYWTCPRPAPIFRVWVQLEDPADPSLVPSKNKRVQGLRTRTLTLDPFKTQTSQHQSDYLCCYGVLWLSFICTSLT